MKTIYIFRHGQTEYNRKGVLQGRAIDAPLNTTGLQQVRAFFETYKHIPFDLIITSELKRSIQSVELFLEKGFKHVIDERITEFSWGSNEGLPLSEIVVNNYKKMLQSWYDGNLDARIPGGESGLELYERVNDFSKSLLALHADHILICTHGRTMKMLLVVLMGWEISQMERVRHSNSALYKVLYKNGNCQLLLENDLKHLPKDLNQNAFWDK